MTLTHTRSTWRWLTLSTILMSAGVFGIGCLGQPPEGAGGPIGTVRIEVADAAAGALRGTYDYEGTTIRFEALRGERNPTEADFGDPLGPEYAVDARICDQRGDCFAARAGGHGFEELGWAGSVNNAELRESVQPSTRMREFEAAWNLAADLDDHPDLVPPGLEFEVEAIVEVGRLISPEERQSGSLDGDVSALETTDIGARMESLTTTAYTQVLDMYRVSLVFADRTYGNHSSVRVRVLSAVTGTALGTFETCNHGRCGGDSSLTRYCNRWFFNRSSVLPLASDCSRSWYLGVPCTGDGCCATPYGLFSGNHVCNNDTQYQRDIMAAGTTAFCSGTCGSPSRWAPSCI